MSPEDLKSCLNLLLTNYGREADANIVGLWTALYGGLDAGLFRAACCKVMAESRFFPNASEILDAYAAVRKEAREEKARASREAVLALAGGAPRCHLCGNTGFCDYNREGSGSCGYVARCVCPYGSDLSRFSAAQVERGYAPPPGALSGKRERALAARGVNPFYWPTIREALGDGFALHDARRRERAVSSPAMSDAARRRVLQGLRDALPRDAAW